MQEISMMTELQQLNSSPLLTQRAFERMSEAQLDELEALYKKEAQENFRNRFRFLQGLYGFSTRSGLGGGYGKYPDFSSYRAALGTNKRSSGPSLPCNCCKQAPAVSQVLPCRHFFCAACTADAESDLKNGFASCDEVGCGSQIDEITRMMSGNATSNTSQPATQPSQTGVARGRRNNNATDAPKDSATNWLNHAGRLMPSTKIDLCKLVVLDRRLKDPACKIIIFSQHLGV